jgi:methyl-accepting chemotaxis protein
MTGRELSWETLISRTSGKPALVLAVPVKVAGATVAVIQTAMQIEDISRIVSWKTGQTGFAFLVDENSKVVAHPSTELTLAQKSLKDHPLIAAFRSDGQPHLVSFTPPGGEPTLDYVRANKLHWGVAVQQDEQELFAPLRRTFAFGLAILIGASIVVALIAWF